jgi:hypothetical protein
MIPNFGKNERDEGKVHHYIEVLFFAIDHDDINMLKKHKIYKKYIDIT